MMHGQQNVKFYHTSSRRNTVHVGGTSSSMAKFCYFQIRFISWRVFRMDLGKNNKDLINLERACLLRGTESTCKFNVTHIPFENFSRKAFSFTSGRKVNRNSLRREHQVIRDTK